MLWHLPLVWVVGERSLTARRVRVSTSDVRSSPKAAVGSTKIMWLVLIDTGRGPRNHPEWLLLQSFNDSDLKWLFPRSEAVGVGCAKYLRPMLPPAH